MKKLHVRTKNSFVNIPVKEKMGTPYRGMLLFSVLLIKCTMLPIDWDEIGGEIPM